MLHEPLDGPDKSVYMEHVMAHPTMEGANGDARALVVAYMCEVIVAMFRCVRAWVRGCVGAWVRGCVGAGVASRLDGRHVRGCMRAWVRA